MIPALLENGHLPLGRHPSTIEEVKNRFAPTGNPIRQEMWSDWIELTELIQLTVGELPAAWLGGSFISSKEAPGDIDCIYLLKRETVLKLPELQQSVIQVIESDSAREHTGNVHAYILYTEEMQGVTSASTNGDATHSLYLRGYWDQLWSRSRHCEKPAYPYCGYLEVIIDGFQQ